MVRRRFVSKSKFPANEGGREKIWTFCLLKKIFKVRRFGFFDWKLDRWGGLDISFEKHPWSGWTKSPVGQTLRSHQLPNNGGHFGRGARTFLMPTQPPSEHFFFPSHSFQPSSPNRTPTQQFLPRLHFPISKRPRPETERPTTCPGLQTPYTPLPPVSLLLLWWRTGREDTGRPEQLSCHKS